MRMTRIAVLVALMATAVAGQSNRTFVSVNGLDNAQCGRSNPCRTFSSALAAVNTGGEVVALDSGGYGPVAISKSATIIGAPGEHVAMAPAMGDAISVSILSTESVVLRGLYLNGLGATTGINFQSGGSLHIENCVIHGFLAYGIDMTASRANLYVADVVVRKNGSDFGAGIRITPTEASLDHQSTASIQRARLEQNNVGLRVTNGEVIARDTIAAANPSAGFVAYVEETGFDAPQLSLVKCDSFNNGYGLFTGGALADMWVDDSRIFANDITYGASSGHIFSSGNNTMEGNHSGPTAFTEFYTKK